jgi:hypothetical protein
VVKGFGRGSKELGIPTANLDIDALGAAADALATGIYYGWARVGAAPEAHMMVMSIGWCVPPRDAIANASAWAPLNGTRSPGNCNGRVVDRCNQTPTP